MCGNLQLPFAEVLIKKQRCFQSAGLLAFVFNFCGALTPNCRSTVREPLYSLFSVK